MADEFQFDVFLSHNSRDKDLVRPLAERLREAGLRVWFDEWSIQPGHIISLKVEEGLEQSRTLVLCLSANALESDWVSLERSTAIHRDPTNSNRRFVPLLLSDCDLPASLKKYRYVDYRDADDAALSELFVVCGSRKPRSQRSSQPDDDTREQKRGGSSQDASASESERGRLSVQYQLRNSFGRHDRVITRLAWAPDGIRLASAGQDGKILIWDTKRGRQAGQLIADGNPDWTVNSPGIAWTPAWSRDGELIACGYGDGVIRIWTVQTERLAFTLPGHFFKTNNVAWSPDGEFLASSADDERIKIWNVKERACISTLFGHREGINTVAWHPSGRILASASLDGSVRLWDTKTHTQTHILSGHNDIVITVTWSPDGKLLASSSGDSTIRLWDPQTGLLLQVLEEHRGPVSCVAFSADGKLLASKGIDRDSTVRIWDVETWNVAVTLDEPSGSMWFAGLAFHPEFPVLATLCDFGRGLRIWDLDPEVMSQQDCATLAHPLRYSSAKVVLLGEGTVGKTSLAHRLIDDEYVVKDRTHGMNVWRLELPEDSHLTPLDDSDPEDAPSDSSESQPKRPVSRSETATLTERETLLWDLAGQEDYRLIHRLFLDETALALLLVNPQKDDPFAETGDWLKALDTAAANHDEKREAERLLVFSQIDVGGMKIGDAKIKRFVDEHGFANWLPTSAKTGENCSDKEDGGRPSKLKQLIAKHIPWDRLPWTSTPKLLAELKNAVMEMRSKSDIRLLRFSELTQRLVARASSSWSSAGGDGAEAQGETDTDRMPVPREADVRTAVTLLANHGLALPLKFGDLLLLQPELLNGYAGAIIRSARAHTDEIGCVFEVDVYDPGFDFTGVDRLPRPDEELLLRAMVQTFLDNSLCIAEDTPQGRQLVFPSQYRREKDIPWQPDVFVSYTFGGEWQTIWTTLVVRLWYSHEFDHRELWRNAAELASNKGHLLGLKIDNKQGEGEATISLFFDVKTPDELKVIFIEYVHRHLSRYGCNVVRDRRYVCQCGKAVLDQAAVRKRLAVKKTFIVCQECDEKVPLIDHIEQRLKTDPVAQRILQMEETATRQLDAQALEQILFGHVQAITGEANQIFRELTKFDYGIDGEVEFKDNNGKPSGKKIYVQLKSGNSYLRTRKSDGREVFDVKNDRHLEYWTSQPVDVWLVIRQTDEHTGEQTIRWMNVSRYLKDRDDKDCRQIIFDGDELTMEAVWRLRDDYFPIDRTTRK